MVEMTAPGIQMSLTLEPTGLYQRKFGPTLVLITDVSAMK